VPAIKVIIEKRMLLIMLGINSLPAKSVLAGTKLVLFGRYVLKFYVGIVQ
jgi:hypothetical protein